MSRPCHLFLENINSNIKSNIIVDSRTTMIISVRLFLFRLFKFKVYFILYILYCTYFIFLVTKISRLKISSLANFFVYYYRI